MIIIIYMRGNKYQELIKQTIQTLMKLIISTYKQQRITQNSVLMYPQYRYRSVKCVRA